ncbi:NAD operon protein [Salinadaptatus halalkaliphilus]|uniref:NAD operon protein n=1 Tax=Salinadaptatus halalkaliphilus TaxID=2419781 RepID=A0A4S3TQN9_9EURY|nr:SAM-dependent chlorinase/fluorinase [Salinadaptatus halalkaliphilus]THE64868.1 NAD operon protein [Salinadaptatus halalkaliphilus]
MITLASDFGSPYPAAMKGVLCARTDARLIDIAHDFPRQDVRAAAFWLREVLAYYPPAIHLAVVDPGVGTDRGAIVVRADDHAIVAPDNGLVRPVARRLADGRDLEAFVVDETALESVEPTGASPVVRSSRDGDDGPATNTFHGRDLFAPAAAAVHKTPIETLETLPFLEPTGAIVDLELPTATIDGEQAIGEVLVVDGFGNVITNVPGSFLESHDRIRANEIDLPVGKTFAAVAVGERLATVGSHGYVELDVNQGRGEEAFELTAGDRVVLERST